MAETYLIRFRVRDEQRARFLHLLTGVLDAMRHEESFIEATLSEAADEPNLFVLHETWTDRRDVLEVQLQRPYREAWHAALPELLDRPREVEILSPLWSHAKAG